MDECKHDCKEIVESWHLSNFFERRLNLKVKVPIYLHRAVHHKECDNV